MAAAIMAVPVVLFDTLEGLIGAMGLDGGAPVLLLIVALFALLWIVAGAVLAWLSPAPAREGLAAGCLVAAIMAAVMAMAARTLDGSLLPLVLVWVVFAALAVGLGALTGLAVDRIRGAIAPGRRTPTRTPALVALACGVLLFLAALPFVAGSGTTTGAGAAMLWMVVAASAALVAAGLWGWRRSVAAQP